MNEPSQEPSRNRPSWQPFMCPSCRGLFRSPSNRTGTAQCPLCESSIQIPELDTQDLETPKPKTKERRASEPKAAPPVAPEEKPLKTEPPLAQAAEKEKESQVTPPLKKRRTQRAESDWEKETSKKGGASKGLILTTLFLLSILIGVAAILLVREKERRMTLFNQGRAKPEGEQTSDSPKKSSFFDFSKSSEDSSQEPILELETADLVTAREAARAFLDCQTIEEFAPLIRDPERVMPLVRKFYQENPYQANAALTIDANGIAQVAKKFASFNVVLRNYTSRPIALELTATGALVDWESWVGYCAIPWETFIENKVTEPTEVRVRVRAANYYNFNFRDDSKWACYHLATSTDGSILYGYALRSAPFLSELPKPNGSEETAVLNINFPDPAVSSNQVIITDFLQSGWVLGL